MRLGDLARLADQLKTIGFSGTLNTAFVERINLTLRHALAALSRRSWATAQLASKLFAHLEWWRAYYHFCCPHLALRRPLARRSEQTPRRYGPRTPAMVAGLTDHIWSVQELLTFPVGQVAAHIGGAYLLPKNREQPTALDEMRNPTSPLRALDFSKSASPPSPRIIPRQKWYYPLTDNAIS